VTALIRCPAVSAGGGAKGQNPAGDDPSGRPAAVASMAAAATLFVDSPQPWAAAISLARRPHLGAELAEAAAGEGGAALAGGAGAGP